MDAEMEALYQRMQAPAQEAAWDRFFAMTPAERGRAALEARQRERREGNLNGPE
jgi:urate oxidase